MAPRNLQTEPTHRPVELARRHGLSAQAVRNYEQQGFLPPADRTPSGHRVYTELHRAALDSFLALVPAYGHRLAGGIMRALNEGDLESALGLIDTGHRQLSRDRDTLAVVRAAVGQLGPGRPPEAAEPGAGRLTVGALAHRIGVVPATLRQWERVGILAPRRDPATGYRSYGPEDVRDAELAHLLRRGGYRLDRVALVVRQVREAGSTGALADSLAEWGDRLNRRGTAMIKASRHLADYLDRLAL